MNGPRRHFHGGSRQDSGDIRALIRRAFVSSDAPPDVDGLGAPARHLLVTVFVLAMLMALLPDFASADSRIDGVSGEGVAVSEREGGDVYGLQNGAIERVDQFTPSGSFVRGFGWGVVPGAGTGSGNVTTGSTTITNVTVTSGSFYGAPYVGAGKIITGSGIPANTMITAVTSSTLEISNPATATGTNVSLAVTAGPGNIPTDEQQRLTVAAAEGEFTLSFTSVNPGSTTETTTPIQYDASAANVQSALEALPNIGAGNVSVSGGPGDEKGINPYLVTFQGRYADVDLLPLSPTNVSLSGGNPSSEATVTKAHVGGGVLEICTTVCAGEPVEEGGFVDFAQGTEPGQLRYSDELAIDNDSSSSHFGDVYVVDQRNYRVERYSPEGKFELMFGGEVDKGPHHPGNVCTSAYITEGDTCGAGTPGSGAGFFHRISDRQGWNEEGENSIAVGPTGTVYVGDFRSVQEFEPNGTYIGQLSLPNAQFVGSLAVDDSGHVYANSSAINAVQQLNKPGEGKVGNGTFSLTFEGQTTAALESDASAGVIQEALEALPTVGANNVAVVAYEKEVNFESFFPTAEIEFVGALRHTNVPQITTSAGSVETQVEGAAGELVELGPSSEVLQHFDTEPDSEPTHIALDASGDLFASDLNGGEFQFRAFKPSGTLYAVFTSDEVEAPFGVPRGIAVGAGNLYATSGGHIAVIPLPTTGPSAVAEEKATNTEPTTATLHAVINPKGNDTHYHFEFVDQLSFEHEGGFASAQTQSTPSSNLGLINRNDGVQAAISNLTPGTVYHYRAVSESSEGIADGADETFETLPPTSIRNFTTQTVGPELVKLKAELNPNGEATTYTIEFGEDSNHPADSAEGELPVGNEFVQIPEVTFSGLKPNTTYHYHVIANNNNGEVKSPDQTVTTEESSIEEREAEHCPNTILREEDSALGLPDCRDYEQVSPAYKAGYGVNGLKFYLAPSGERVVFTSEGVFAGAAETHGGATYAAHRTPTGWLTQATLGRPGGSSGGQPVGPQPFNAELNKWLFPVEEGSNWVEGNYNSKSETFYLGAEDGSFVAASPSLQRVEGGLLENAPNLHSGQSTDFSHFVFETPYRLLESDPRPDGSDRLYEVSGAGGPEPALTLLAEVAPNITAEGCNVDQAIGQETNLVSADGSTVFYDAPLDLSPGEKCSGPFGGPNKNVLFVRVGDAPPIQVAGPPPSQCTAPSPCATAAAEESEFYGASPEGTQAWFTTTQPLINSDRDSGKDLYLAKLESGELKELIQASAGEADSSHPTPGEGAGVQGVVRTSSNGSRAYFVARGVLTTQGNALGGQAQSGADNLFAYDSRSGETKFVTRLCSGPEESGTQADPACPANLDGSERNDTALWRGGEGDQSQLTPDGSYLVFTSYGRLTSDKTSSAKAVFRYDFQTGQLIRISIGRDGNDGNGNDDAFNAEIRGAEQEDGGEASADDGNRAITDDGSTIVFTTRAPLVSHDTNEKADLYEWEEAGAGSCHETAGCVYPVSSGLDPHDVEGGMISATGDDITFITSRSLVPDDKDGNPDVYDVRVDGGFPASHPSEGCGAAESCRPTPKAEPTPPALGTEGFVGPGNAEEHLHCAKGKRRVVRHGQPRCILIRHKKKHLAPKQRRAGISRRRVK